MRISESVVEPVPHINDDRVRNVMVKFAEDLPGGGGIAESLRCQTTYYTQGALVFSSKRRQAV